MALHIKPNHRVSVNKENAIKEVLAEPMSKLTINIPKSLHSEFKIAAVHSNSNMTEIVIDWIKQYIQK